MSPMTKSEVRCNRTDVAAEAIFLTAAAVRGGAVFLNAATNIARTAMRTRHPTATLMTVLDKAAGDFVPVFASVAMEPTASKQEMQHSDRQEHFSRHRVGHDEWSSNRDNIPLRSTANSVRQREPTGTVSSLPLRPKPCDVGRNRSSCHYHILYDRVNAFPAGLE